MKGAAGGHVSSAVDARLRAFRHDRRRARISAGALVARAREKVRPARCRHYEGGGRDRMELRPEARSRPVAILPIRRTVFGMSGTKILREQVCRRRRLRTSRVSVRAASPSSSAAIASIATLGHKARRDNCLGLYRCLPRLHKAPARPGAMDVRTGFTQPGKRRRKFRGLEVLGLVNAADCSTSRGPHPSAAA